MRVQQGDILLLRETGADYFRKFRLGIVAAVAPIDLGAIYRCDPYNVIHVEEIPELGTPTAAAREMLFFPEAEDLKHVVDNTGTWAIESVHRKD